MRKPRVDAPYASGRYTPRDTTPAATRGAVRGGTITNTTTNTAANASIVTARPRSTIESAKPVTSSVIAPRLSMPRSNTASGIMQPRASSGSYWHGSYDNCHRSTWYGYWDPCHSHNYYWNHCNDWHVGFCGGSFGWNLSLWYPFWSCRSYYWDHCYSDSFWCSWSQPCYGNYWWYPSTTYCPTYLYVPNTVYVTEEASADSNGSGNGGGSTEVVVAGGGVVGAARAVEVAPGRDDMSTTLAMKYVELGDFYFKANRFRDAAEAYGKARSYAPDDASIHFVLADAVFADGDYHYAAFLIGEGLRLDPAMASADTDKRTFYAEVKVFEAQMAALDAYLAKTPYDAQGHFVRGYNLRFSGQHTSAMAAFRRVLEIEPGHRGAAAFAAALAAAPAAK